MLNKTLTSAIITYGGECRPLSKEVGNVLRIFERRMLETIQRPMNDSGVRRTRYSNELYTLYDELDIVTVTKKED